MKMFHRLLVALASSTASGMVFAQHWDDGHDRRDDHGHYDRGCHDDRG